VIGKCHHRLGDARRGIVATTVWQPVLFGRISVAGAVGVAVIGFSEVVLARIAFATEAFFSAPRSGKFDDCPHQRQGFLGALQLAHRFLKMDQ
jgi:hypothetical protein